MQKGTRTVSESIDNQNDNQKRDNAMTKHAVILAAGDSQRFREKGVELPKVLLKVGGLRLLERSILGLYHAGIEHFYITVGAYKKEIEEVMATCDSLKSMDIKYIQCPDYQLGNGVSFGKGAENIEASFLLTMSDHIFSATMLAAFMQDNAQNPNFPSLACDPNLGDVFDMDDATKVLSKNEMIFKIGKEIPSYDLVDTGLFYFPAGYGPKVAKMAREGAYGVSNIIQKLIDEKGVRTAIIENALWQDVDNPSMKAEAERRLLLMNRTLSTL